MSVFCFWSLLLGFSSSCLSLSLSLIGRNNASFVADDVNFVLLQQLDLVIAKKISYTGRDRVCVCVCVCACVCVCVCVCVFVLNYKSCFQNFTNVQVIISARPIYCELIWYITDIGKSQIHWYMCLITCRYESFLFLFRKLFNFMQGLLLSSVNAHLCHKRDSGF